MRALLDRVRAGLPVTLIDKVRAETCLDVLDGMRAEISARGQVLTAAEAEAFALRRAELVRGVT